MDGAAGQKVCTFMKGDAPAITLSANFAGIQFTIISHPFICKDNKLEIMITLKRERQNIYN